MEYYERRKLAVVSIDKMFAAGKTSDEVIKHIEEFYGFSSKMVKERLELLNRLEIK